MYPQAVILGSVKVAPFGGYFLITTGGSVSFPDIVTIKDSDHSLSSRYGISLAFALTSYVPGSSHAWKLRI